MLDQAGYNGEKIVFLHPTDQLAYNAISTVVVDAFHKVGLNVDEQMTDWGTVVQRRPSREPLGKGGWSMFPAGAPGPEYVDPLLANTLRSNGAKAWFGWPDDPVLEAAYEAWIDAPDDTTRREQEIAFQTAAFASVPSIPLGQYLPHAAWRSNVTGLVKGLRAGVLERSEGIAVITEATRQPRRPGARRWKEARPHRRLVSRQIQLSAPSPTPTTSAETACRPNQPDPGHPDPGHPDPGRMQRRRAACRARGDAGDGHAVRQDPAAARSPQLNRPARWARHLPPTTPAACAGTHDRRRGRRRTNATGHQPVARSRSGPGRSTRSLVHQGYRLWTAVRRTPAAKPVNGDRIRSE